MRLLLILPLLVLPAYTGRASDATDQVLTKKIALVLEQCAKLKPGTTRAEVYKIFDEQGGLYFPWDITLDYASCRTIHVQVKFAKADPKETDESPKDTVIEISQPFLDAHHGPFAD